jgi:hypothetical protein
MENPVMKKHMHAIGIIVMMLSPAVTANAYHGGGHGGGGGFHGGGGGFHGGGGGFHGGGGGGHGGGGHR